MAARYQQRARRTWQMLAGRLVAAVTRSSAGLFIR